MRSYFIDEISPRDMKKIEEYLRKNAIPSSIENLFWIQIPEGILTKEQIEHKECAPYMCAIELGKDWIKLEFFVRSSKSLRCSCTGYCTERQRSFLIDYVNRMINQLGIRT